jgi:hypothetical protein
VTKNDVRFYFCVAVVTAAAALSDGAAFFGPLAVCGVNDALDNDSKEEEEKSEEEEPNPKPNESTPDKEPDKEDASGGEMG